MQKPKPIVLPPAGPQEVQDFGYQRQHSPQRPRVPERQRQLEDLVEQAKQEEELEGLNEYSLGFLLP